jgi:hypothetical protein
VSTPISPDTLDGPAVDTTTTTGDGFTAAGGDAGGPAHARPAPTTGTLRTAGPTCTPTEATNTNTKATHSRLRHMTIHPSPGSGPLDGDER